MLKRETRIAILELHARGQGVRPIARAVGVSRETVTKVLRSDEPERPDMQRASQLDDELERVRDLYTHCKGNLVRVHEELEKAGVQVGYTTLTAFCRREEIGVVEKVPAGTYHFAPGVEMQHDTSPHDVTIASRSRRLQCASLVLCHSRMILAQLYPTFDRFYAKTFLTDALQFFGGSAETCMVDNTHVIVAYGTGKDMVPAPEMEAFAKRFGFRFVAHERGDANRSARVERPFNYIERNFYAGRTFTDLADANAQLREWCQKSNQTHRRKLHAAPIDLLATRVVERRVDVERYATLHNNRYSAPPALIDQMVEVHETLRHVRIFHRHKLVAQHDAFEPGAERTSTLQEHKRARGASKAPPPVGPEEATLIAAAPSSSR